MAMVAESATSMSPTRKYDRNRELEALVLKEV